MSYKKPKKQKATVTIAAAKPPTLASIIINKVAAAFAPLNKFQQALYYTDNVQKPSKIAQWFKRNAAAIAIVEKAVFISFAIFALFTNPYLLLVLPATGALIFYRNRVKWLWWKFKVFVLLRSYYEDRRELYKVGSLWHHLTPKRPRVYGNAVVWGESIAVITIKHTALKQAGILKNKEYILNVQTKINPKKDN